MSWYERIPKVEIHLHLEGAIPLPALWQLVEKYGGDPEVPSLEALERRFEYRDFPHFLETWHWKNAYLRQYEDFTFLAEAVARDLERQNVRYAEVFYSPPDFAGHGLLTQELTAAIRAGLARVGGVEVALVADLVRDYGPRRAIATLAEVSDLGELGVVGVGIGGSEHKFPPEPFAGVFAEARRRGLRTSAHAGEAAGAASVWGAVRALSVDRIGHATRCGEDPALVEHLVAARIPLEMCPLSNVRTGVVAAIEEHPVRRFFERGLVVTVNTDDPKMFGTSLAGEYRLLVERLGFSRGDVRRLVLNAAEASWLPEDRRRLLVAELADDPVWRQAAAGECR